MNPRDIRAATTVSVLTGVMKSVAPNTGDWLHRAFCFQTVEDIEDTLRHLSLLDEVGMVRLLPTGYFKLCYSHHNHFEKWSKGIPKWYEQVTKHPSRVKNGISTGSEYKLTRVLSLGAISAVQRLPRKMTEAQLDYVSSCIIDGLNLDADSDFGRIRRRLGNNANFEETTLQALIGVISVDQTLSFSTSGDAHYIDVSYVLSNLSRVGAFLPQINKIMNRYAADNSGRVTYLLSLQYMLALQVLLDRIGANGRASIVGTGPLFQILNKKIEAICKETNATHYAFSNELIGIFHRHSEANRKVAHLPPQPSEQMLILAAENLDNQLLERKLSDSFYLELWAFNAVVWMITPFDIPLYEELLNAEDLSSMNPRDREKARLILVFRRLIVRPMKTMPITFKNAMDVAAERIFKKHGNQQLLRKRLERMKKIANEQFDFQVEDVDASFLNSFHIVGGELYSLRASEILNHVLEPAFHNKSMISSLMEAFKRDKNSPAALFLTIGALFTGAGGVKGWAEKLFLEEDLSTELGKSIQATKDEVLNGGELAFEADEAISIAARSYKKAIECLEP